VSPIGQVSKASDHSCTCMLCAGSFSIKCAKYSLSNLLEASSFSNSVITLWMVSCDTMLVNLAIQTVSKSPRFTPTSTAPLAISTTRLLSFCASKTIEFSLKREEPKTQPSSARARSSRKDCEKRPEEGSA